MPRIRVYEERALRTEDYGDNDPQDYCARCYPGAVKQCQSAMGPEWQKDKNRTWATAPGCEVDHPCYDETDYECRKCEKALSHRDC